MRSLGEAKPASTRSRLGKRSGSSADRTALSLSGRSGCPWPVSCARQASWVMRAVVTAWSCLTQPPSSQRNHGPPHTGTQSSGESAESSLPCRYCHRTAKQSEQRCSWRQERGVETPLKHLGHRTIGGRVACAYVQPATVKAHALVASAGFQHPAWPTLREAHRSKAGRRT